MQLPFKTLDQVREDLEREYLTAVLKAARGDVTLTARIVGRNRTKIYTVLKQSGLVARDFRPSRSPSHPEPISAKQPLKEWFGIPVGPA